MLGRVDSPIQITHVMPELGGSFGQRIAGIADNQLRRPSCLVAAPQAWPIRRMIDIDIYVD
jgi:hypothetical protein